MNEVEIIKQKALAELDGIATEVELEAFVIRYMGRKEGVLTTLLKSLKDKTIEEKKTLGFLANEFKNELAISIDRKKEELARHTKTAHRVDVTHPAHDVACGYLHPLTKIEQEIRSIFLSLNFSSVEGPEVEKEYYNFDALNIPKDHPAREMWDTMWLDPKHNTAKDKHLLRTHTSPVQVRYMETHQPPFQIIVPGRTFRNEAIDATHEINFHQLEGLMVGPHVSLAHFKYIVLAFLKQLYKQDVDVRFRPSYFPFVEPGLEVDMRFERSNRWLEMGGAGMVHPNVFKAVGYDPTQVSGFAFGFGIERLAMIKYGITDIRLFYSGDLRFITQPYQ